MKKTLLSLFFLIVASSAQAQTTTTTTVSFGGIVNCQAISMNITRVQNGDTKTTIDFSIKECYPGETYPQKSIASLNSPIPNSDFTTDRSGAHLITNSPYGPIDITWTITKDSHTSYDATWTWYTPNNSRQTQNDDNQSARATGNIGSWVIDKNGYFTTSVFKK
jgi:hypothetical protein